MLKIWRGISCSQLHSSCSDASCRVATVYTGRDKATVGTIILTLCQLVIDWTTHQFNVGDFSWRAALSVNRVTDYTGFYCILPLASVCRYGVFVILLVRRKGQCESCLSGQHETHENLKSKWINKNEKFRANNINNSYYLYAFFSSVAGVFSAVDFFKFKKH